MKTAESRHSRASESPLGIREFKRILNFRFLRNDRKTKLRIHMEKIEVNANNLCFACGPANPIGLKMVFRHEDGKAKAEFTPGPYHQSWDGVFHGGLLALCLDEAGGYALYFEGIKAMTARMEMRLRKTIRPGEKIYLTGEIRKKTRKIVETYATVELEDGTLAAEGTAIMFVVEGKTG